MTKPDAFIEKQVAALVAKGVDEARARIIVANTFDA